MAVRCSTESFSCSRGRVREARTGVNDANQELQVSVLVLDHRSAGVAARARDHQSPHLMEVGRCHWLWERELACKDRRNANLIGLNVDIGGDYRPGGVVNTLALIDWSAPSCERENPAQILPSCASGRDPLSSPTVASHQAAEACPVALAAGFCCCR